MISHGLVINSHAGDQPLFAQHRANLMADLDRRLAVARQSGNQALQTLLEGERQQIQVSWDRPTIQKAAPSRLHDLWQRVLAYLQQPLEIEQVSDNQGRTWWYAFDHHSGKKLYAETEADVLRWIEENRLGA